LYIFDTDAVIYTIKGHPNVENNLRKHFDDPIKMGLITLMELYYGACKSQRVTSNLAKIKNLEEALEVIP
jgi:tRNA(fMet)-specific endonuclease VapC